MNIPHKEVITTAKQAGTAIMSIYSRPIEVEEKADNSPLTEADTAAHNLIEQALNKLTPDIPILSEESADIPWETRKAWHTYWLVDPLDGTKEFIKKNGEFTVNIALIENGQPVWGVVHAPALNTTYHGGTATGESIKETGEGSTTITTAKPPEGNIGWRIVGSRSHQSEEFKAFTARYHDPIIKSMGSSLKICLVADGQADLYPRLGLTSEWDTAAAHAVLLGANGQITIAGTDQPLTYNQKESVLNPHFICSAT